MVRVHKNRHPQNRTLHHRNPTLRHKNSHRLFCPFPDPSRSPVSTVGNAYKRRRCSIKCCIVVRAERTESGFSDLSLLVAISRPITLHPRWLN